MALDDGISGVVAAIRDKINTIMPRLLPSGGTTGQALTKSSGTDYAVAWTTVSGGGGSSNLTIGTVAPTPATGVTNLWIDTTDGYARMNLVTGD